MNPQIDHYLSEGCGRCPLGGTPACKVHNWPQELKKLGTIVLDCGLTEELKWGVPCYTFHNNNVLIVSALKDYVALSFFKGALLSDTNGTLQKPGENSQAARLIKFTSPSAITAMEDILKAYIFEAIEVEKAGLEVVFKKNPEPFPKELENKLTEYPAFKAAFEALTPGRQRGYVLHFSQPKQAATRESRIGKCIPKIMEGKGFNDR
ncbi:MAG: hypothetical protein COW03_08855 [Cytophagales bacterium CG12_big_fil_rev_8_21_14_0_65_40_12]|nr:MAG: hypothetical protein COW03_08855 [Cytophagales bacterium CG12_big_fil_rev_8_21_14_0_65_40_12]PIW05973.1 MAG: hypothetical protein COW40_02015 [Cytophagales bacterium CG17_big_fil_post_rev_8_21_14_2_50_40_13]